jgi:zinc transport system substrate-binding protein
MKNTFLLSIITLSALLLTGCGMTNTTTSTETQKPVIVTSFFPITHIVEKIVGDKADIIQILPEWAEWHGYEPTPEQVKKIEESDLVIILGESMESYSEKLKTLMVSKNKAYLDFSDTVINIAESEEEHHDEHEEEWEHAHEGLDPHIWLSPRSYTQMADIISKKIREVFPDIATETSAQKLTQELTALDQEFTKGLSQCETRKFVTSHAAFGYLARDYGLTQIPVAGISPEEEPSPKVIAETIELVKKEKLSALFSEPLVSPKLINTIATETGAKTYLLNPLESLTSSETELGYIGVMKQNLSYIREGLNCQ